MYGVPVLSPTGPSLKLQIFLIRFTVFKSASKKHEARTESSRKEIALKQYINIRCTGCLCYLPRGHRSGCKHSSKQTFLYSDNECLKPLPFKRKTLSATTTCQNEVELPEHVGKGKAKDWSPRRDCCHRSPVGLVAHIPCHPEG